jgi:hypothetical protein
MKTVRIHIFRHHMKESFQAENKIEPPTKAGATLQS